MLSIFEISFLDDKQLHTREKFILSYLLIMWNHHHFSMMNRISCRQIVHL